MVSGAATNLDEKIMETDLSLKKIAKIILHQLLDKSDKSVSFFSS